MFKLFFKGDLSRLYTIFLEQMKDFSGGYSFPALNFLSLSQN